MQPGKIVSTSITFISVGREESNLDKCHLANRDGLITLETCPYRTPVLSISLHSAYKLSAFCFSEIEFSSSPLFQLS